MTKKAQDAYMRGFRKVAKANGVDPEGLYKYAQGRVIKHVLSRFGNLLRGGNKAGLEKQVSSMENALTAGSKGMKTLEETTNPLIKNTLLTTANGSNIQLDDAYAMLKDAPEVVRASRRGLVEARKALDTEKAKVLAARAGLGTGLLGLGAYALSGNNEPKYPIRPRYYYGY